MNARSWSLSILRMLTAVTVLLAGFFISALLGSMTGLYLNEHESGLDHLSQPITLWGLVLSGLFGAAGIAGFRALLRHRIRSRWLLAALVLPAAAALLLVFAPD